jgi:hypothetical protein
MWKWSLIVVALMLLGLSCAETTNPSLPLEQRVGTTPAADKLPATEFTLEEFDWEYGNFGTLYVVGKVTNNTSKTYGYVQVSINLYDESGAQVGSTLDNLNNLEPHGVWKFKAIVLEDKATRAEVKEITGF